jgi:hypothetical protein
VVQGASAAPGTQVNRTAYKQPWMTQWVNLVKLLVELLLVLQWTLLANMTVGWRLLLNKRNVDTVDTARSERL